MTIGAVEGWWCVENLIHQMHYIKWRCNGENFEWTWESRVLKVVAMDTSSTKRFPFAPIEVGAPSFMLLGTF
jgi:hypothetical protein